MQLKSTMRYYYTHLLELIKLKTDFTKCWQGRRATRIHIHCEEFKMIQQSFGENVKQFFKKVNIIAPCDSDIPLLGA